MRANPEALAAAVRHARAAALSVIP
jgi:hypothetical protein